MKKFLAFLIAGLFALSVAGVVVAEETKATAAPAAKEAAAAKAGKTAKSRVLTGSVEAVDAAAGTITVKGRKQAVTLKAAEGVKLEDVNTGDKVTVTFKGESLSKVVRAKSGKAGCPKCCKDCKCKDCKDCPKDCKDCSGCKDCKDCPKAAKGGRNCKECPNAGDAAPKGEAEPKK